MTVAPRPGGAAGKVAVISFGEGQPGPRTMSNTGLRVAGFQARHLPGYPVRGAGKGRHYPAHRPVSPRVIKSLKLRQRRIEYAHDFITAHQKISFIFVAGSWRVEDSSSFCKPRTANRPQ